MATRPPRAVTEPHYNSSSPSPTVADCTVVRPLQYEYEKIRFLILVETRARCVSCKVKALQTHRYPADTLRAPAQSWARTRLLHHRSSFPRTDVRDCGRFSPSDSLKCMVAGAVTRVMHQAINSIWAHTNRGFISFAYYGHLWYIGFHCGEWECPLMNA